MTTHLDPPSVLRYGEFVNWLYNAFMDKIESNSKSDADFISDAKSAYDIYQDWQFVCTVIAMAHTVRSLYDYINGYNNKNRKSVLLNANYAYNMSGDMERQCKRLFPDIFDYYKKNETNSAD